MIDAGFTGIAYHIVEEAVQEEAQSDVSNTEMGLIPLRKDAQTQVSFKACGTCTATRVHERTAGSVPRSMESGRAGDAKVDDATEPLTTGTGSKGRVRFARLPCETCRARKVAPCLNCNRLSAELQRKQEDYAAGERLTRYLDARYTWLRRLVTELVDDTHHRGILGQLDELTGCRVDAASSVISEEELARVLKALDDRFPVLVHQTKEETARLRRERAANAELASEACSLRKLDSSIL